MTIIAAVLIGAAKLSAHGQANDATITPAVESTVLAGTGLCERRRTGLPARVYSRKFMWENDVGITDRDYTNGMKWERYLYRECRDSLGGLGVATATLHSAMPGARGEGARRSLGYSFGMNFYTPGDISTERLQPMDRPYTGWAYGSLISVSQFVAGDRITGSSRFEAMVGVLGDWAQQDVVQEKWHEWIDATEPRGWHHQQSGAIGINAVYDRQIHNYFRKDHIQTTYGFGGALGNVRTELKAALGIGFTTNPLSWSFVDTAIITPSVQRAAANATRSFEKTDLAGLSETQQQALRERTDYDDLAAALLPARFFTFSVRIEPRYKITDYFLDAQPATGRNAFGTKRWVTDAVVSIDFKIRRFRKSVIGFREAWRSREISSSLAEDHRFRQFMWRRYFQ